MMQITVTVSADHLESIDEVAADLRKAGMKIGQTLRGIGVITGSVAEENRSALRAVAGVAGVDAQISYSIPPPDESIQ